MNHVHRHSFDREKKLIRLLVLIIAVLFGSALQNFAHDILTANLFYKNAQNIITSTFIEIFMYQSPLFIKQPVMSQA